MPRVAVSEALERELQELSNEIRRLDSETAEKMTAAEALVADIRESGTNPLTDSDAFDRVDAAYKEADGPKEQASVLRQRRERVLEMMGRREPAQGTDAPAPSRTAFAEAIVSSPEYARLRDSGAFDSPNARIEIAPVEVISREDAVSRFHRGQGFLAQATVQPLVPPDLQLWPPVPIPVRAVTVLDLITMATTNSDTVDWVLETVRSDVAAETAPGVAANQADYQYTLQQSSVRDITQFVAAHKRNLADEGQIQALLEGRLEAGVIRRFESQVVQGDGAGQNIKGILNTTGIGTVARGGSEARLEAIHRGITTVRLSLFAEPDAIGVHPTSYEATVFEKGSDGQYLLGPASQQTSRTIWGFPVAVTSAFPAGTAVPGNYSEGAVAWLRSGVSVSASDSHSDFFVRRMVALLAELRAAFAAWQPRAFTAVTNL